MSFLNFESSYLIPFLIHQDKSQLFEQEFIKTCVENEKFVQLMFTPNQTFTLNHNNLDKGIEKFVLENFENKISQLISEKINSMFTKDLIESINFKDETFSQSMEINNCKQENPEFQIDNLKKRNYFEKNNNFISDENSSNSTSQQSKRRLIKKMIHRPIPKGKFMSLNYKDYIRNKRLLKHRKSINLKSLLYNPYKLYFPSSTTSNLEKIIRQKVYLNMYNN